MASVQTSDGVVRNLIDANPGDNRQRIAVSPAAFGAQVEPVRDRLGETLVKIGETGFDAGEHFARVQVDDQINKWMTDANKQLDGFRALEGQDRLHARSRVEKTIEDSAKTLRDGLKLPFQQQLFDRQARNFQQGYLSAQFSSLSQQADRSYKTQVAKSSFDQAVNMAAVGASDPQSVAVARENARSAMVNLLEAEGNGEDETLYRGAIEAADRAIYRSVVESVAVTNPKLALEIADQQKDALGVSYVPLAEHLRTRLNQQEGFAVADAAIMGGAAQLANPPAAAADKTTGLRHAIYDQEGGPPSNPTQIQPDTWEQWRKEGLVHEGDKFGDPESMKRVSDRAFAKYENDYRDKDGKPDPDRVAVAWFSGPGNVAPAGSAQPYRENRQDRNGKTVESYVADIRGRIGGQRGAMYEAKASAYDRVLAATEGRPEVRKVALAEIDQWFNAAQTAALAKDKARTEATQAALRGYGDAIRAGEAGQPWYKDPRLSEEQVRDLDDYQQKRLKPELEGSPSNPGTGFSEAFQGVQTGAITNDGQLLALVRQGKLTPWGYDYVSARLKKYNEPGQEITKRLESEAFTSAKRQVLMQVDTSVEPPIARMRKWDRAILAGSVAVEQARAKNVPDAKIFDPESKDGFWAAVKPFMPDANERTAAMMADDLHKADAQVPFDWQKIQTPAEATAAWMRGDLDESQARQLMVLRGWGPKNASPAPPVK